MLYPVLTCDLFSEAGRALGASYSAPVSWANSFVYLYLRSSILNGPEVGSYRFLILKDDQTLRAVSEMSYRVLSMCCGSSERFSVLVCT